METKWSFFLFSIVIFCTICSQNARASTAPDVTLVLPQNQNVSSIKNMTFVCNSTDDNNVYNASLYNDIGGNFGLHETKRLMGFVNDSSALLVCGFDGTYTCDGGETGSASGTQFQSSMLMEGVLVDSGDTLTYPLSGNIDYEQGTLQMWLEVGFVPYDYEVWLFSTGNTYVNAIHLWNDYETLKFEYYDDYGDVVTAYSVISWQVGEWHHVAAIWDVNNLVGSGKAVDMFIDGSNASTQYSGTLGSLSGFSSPLMYIGSVGPYSQPDSVFDEFGIYDRVFSASEINASYHNAISSHNDESVNWTVTGIPDGTYMWNCLAYDNESNSSWSSANYTFSIDSSTPPSVAGVNLNPASEDEIDPNVVINVTANITDVSNVSFVMLQYKSPYTGFFTNDTMDYNSGTGLWENGSIVTNSDEGNWTYRFWYNDTWGTGGYSATYVLSVQKDSSWNMIIYNASGDPSATLGETSGFKETVQKLGSIRINNTGDYTANFDLSSTYDLSYNVSEPFDLASGSVKDVEINITLPTTPNEYTVEINVSSTSVPSSTVINGTAISYIGGPYINETTEIITYPVSIKQSSSANFTASVKNIGNETASNVTLNWTLPNGWSLTYGNLSESLGDLSPYETSTVTVTAHTSSSATAGAATVWINSTSDEGTAGYDFKTVAVSCNSGDGKCGSGCSYATDDDCEAPSGSSTSTGGDILGTIAVREPSMDVSVPARLELTKGRDYNLTVYVKNDVTNTNLTDVSLSIDGYPEDLVRVVPDKISYVNPGKSGKFVLYVDVPPYMEDKLYIVDVLVKADGIYAGGSKALEYSSKVIFSVHGVDEAESLGAIEDAETALEEMMDSGFSYQGLEGMLADAKNAYENQDFDSAEGIARNIVQLKEKAFGISSSLDSLGADIADAQAYGIYVDDSAKLLSLATSAFQRGDYERAESRLEAAVNTYQLETKNLLGLMLFLQKNWYYVTAFIIAIVLSSLFIVRRMRIRYMRSRLDNTRKRQKSVRKLLGVLQEDYYRKHTKSKLEYRTEKDMYDKRLADLVFEEMELERKLSGESLEKKRDHVNNHIRQLQKDYFEKGLMGKSQYEGKIRSLERELADIEKDTKGKPKRSKGTAAVMVFIAFCILSSCVMSANAAGNVTAEDVNSAIASARLAIADLGDNGFDTIRANRTLQTSLDQMSSGEYDSALTNARYVVILKNKAFAVSDSLDNVEFTMQELSSQGFEIQDANVLFERALVEFDGENYEDAEASLADAMDILDKIEREAAISRAAGDNVIESLANNIYENRETSAVVLAVVIMITLFAFRVGRDVRKKRRRTLVENSIEDIKRAVKNLQSDYFSKGRTSRRDYESRMDEYRKSLQRYLEEMSAGK